MRLEPIGRFPGLRGLAWAGDALYAARGYQVVRAVVRADAAAGRRDDLDAVRWETVASFDPGLIRGAAVFCPPARRLLRAGFHSLVVLPRGRLVGAVAGAIVAADPGDSRFTVVFRIVRGTRPLNIALGGDGSLYWGEYFGNPGRQEAFVYGSRDGGETWATAYRFPAGAVKHVHGVLWDRHRGCYWVFTGDDGQECRVLRASEDWTRVETVLQGGQDARVAAAVPGEDALYFGTDTPLSPNSVRRLDDSGRVAELAPLAGSCLQACEVPGAMFFSTAVEPSRVNPGRDATLVGSRDGIVWSELLRWRKDAWPFKAFGFGTILLPGGASGTGMLATTGQALKGHDDVLELWRTVW